MEQLNPEYSGRLAFQLRTTKEITGSAVIRACTALYVSRVIHHDLVYGNASA